MPSRGVDGSMDGLSARFLTTMPVDIYLDCNATTPVLPAALVAAQQAMALLYGNPSSTHVSGLQARQVVDTVRARAARVLGAGAGEVVFVSGATEGIQTAVLSALCAVRARRDEGEFAGTLLLYGATEHKAVPESLAHWNQVLGLHMELRALPVDRRGRHDLATLRAWAPHAALVCTMAANNETGVVSDLAGIQAVLDAVAPQSYWLVDCVQALGKLHLQLAQTRIDYAPFSGHKLYAPKGIGLLYVRDGAPFTPLMAGGGQEAGLRSGTENMAGIAALGAVLQALEDGGSFCSFAEMLQFREQLVQSLQAAWPNMALNAVEHTLPTTLNFSVPGLPSSTLVDVLDAAGVRVSAGSACSAKKAAPSHVLQAMGLPDWQAASAVRLSFGALADADFIESACTCIARCGEVLRAQCPPHLEALPHENLEPLRLGVALGDDPASHVKPADLADFWQRYPDALLVDVREAHEHAVDMQLQRFGRIACNIPLGELGASLAGWLQRPQPVLLFCRTGRRSSQALQRMRQLGYTQAWQVAGGVAAAASDLLQN